MMRWFSTEPARVAVCAAGITLGIALTASLLTPLSRAESTTPTPILPESAAQIVEQDGTAPAGPGFTSEAMMAEIEALFLRHQDYEKTLTARLAGMSPQEQQQVALESAAATEQLMTDVLRVQARHAREAGHEEFAQRIEAQIEIREKALADPASRIQLVTEKSRQPSHAASPSAIEPSATVNSEGLGQQGGQR